MQDAAYGTLLRSKRRELHARIAWALEEEPTAAATQPELLAHHCASAGLTEKAIFYWQRAGERSKARSAMVEAIAQIQKALDLLRDLPEAPNRQRTEIELRLALGGALLAARGHASEQTGKAYARARYLCEVLDDWARVETGDVATGMDELRSGIAGFRASGAEWILPLFLAHLASAHAKAGRVEDGLDRIFEALVLSEKSEVRWFEAELHRRRSELLGAGPRVAEAEAEACLRRAIAIARRQDAKLWELRAATNLARLWCSQGKHSEAQNLLAPVYGWFTEGFDTLDLKQAKALVDELAA